jgi:DNA-binding GntR family transcriptional regulator
MAAAEQKAYEAIRSGIASGAFQAGMHLGAADLAERYGISRTPVREALRRLHAEGFVEFFANRGAYVSNWSQADIEEVFALRTVLEGHAAELSAARLRPGEIQRLAQLADAMEALASDGPGRDLQKLAETNGEFHRIIISAAANRRLAAMISGLVEMALVARTFGFYSEDDLARSMTHHRELIAAFSARDPTWAGSVMRSHIRAAHHVYVSSVEARTGTERTNS